ncbi:MAG: VWA domain-containing protein [Lentisphaeraceae bacterium]|nr:VWA domain-containing protein [Lentisphaeraceae bacterium]
MIEFLYGWLFLVFFIPFLIPFLLPEHSERKKSVKMPFFDELVNLTGQNPNKKISRASSKVQKIIVWLSWVLLIIALARPQYIEKPIVKPVASRDLLLAVDLSGSMETEDFQNSEGEQVSRLVAIKEVLSDFLKNREGDRVGLIFFGSAAFIQMPFTEDLEICQQLLDEAQVRMAGPQTMMGDAIGLAITVFKRSELDDKLLILLTDGNDTGSQVLPDKASEIARDKGIVIHTVAVGDPAAAGEQLLDEKTLKGISSTTGGRYFWAGDRKKLAEIYTEIDKLGTRELETVSHRPKNELYFWPLSVFLAIIMFFHFYKLWMVSRIKPRSEVLDV